MRWDTTPIRAQIEAKIKAAGVAQFTLTVVDADTEFRGKTVGTCELGTKKIVYLESEAAAEGVPIAAPKASAAAKKESEPILTECKDGRVLLGGNCK